MRYNKWLNNYSILICITIILLGLAAVIFRFELQAYVPTLQQDNMQEEDVQLVLWSPNDEEAMPSQLKPGLHTVRALSDFLLKRLELLAEWRNGCS